MKEQPFYCVLTGAMGAGKSTVINRLAQKGFICVHEPAREILAEQRSIDADGVPEKDAGLFTRLMLSRAVNNYKRNSESTRPVIFDRAIPDIIAYACLFELDTKIYYNAGRYYKYNGTVFLFEGWEEIYTNDDERKMGFEPANKFGNNVKHVYNELGYNTVVVPKVSIEERIKFIADKIGRT